ncbi:hypothetical protein GW17_00036278 [Ensete ventricosum]|nr:hypothetical protein GW17_00036278 [Ensete ventricosum]
MASKTLLMLLAALSLCVTLSGSADAQGLSVGYYGKACPKAEAIVFEEMTKIIKVAPSLAGPLLRMHFHDCFVRVGGCDGSVLLNSTTGNVAEKDARPNLSLRGYGVIDRVKAKLEKACPGVVSCADILALVARDAVSKGSFWPVPTGRRDGVVSIANETKQLPPPTANITTLISMFAAQGLSVKDLVVLSGNNIMISGTRKNSYLDF